MKHARTHALLPSITLLVLVILVADTNALAQKRQHISATAQGTSTQLGRMMQIDVRITEYSTPDDQKALLEAFAENGSEGLTNAVEKMGSKGRISITGTIGYDLNYIREFKLPDGGRKIRFITDRPITFGEHWGGTRSMDYTLSMGEIIIPKGGKAKGTLMPASRFRLNKEKEIEIETFQNPWTLMNIKVWK
jgi:hypothetical protein